MSDRSTGEDAPRTQPDQAEGERDDAMEERVTRGPHGSAGQDTADQVSPTPDQAEGEREDAA